MVTPLPPSSFRSVPWKNGAGVATTIAEERLPGASLDNWDGVIWRLGHTTIAEDGPFSDLAGFDRLQAVIAGRGLVLRTPAGEVDLRQPFQIRRYRGEAPITCELQHGPVDVINFIGDRDLVSIDLALIREGPAGFAKPGVHIVWASEAHAEVTLGGESFMVAAGHGARVETGRTMRIGVAGGRCWLATIMTI